MAIPPARGPTALLYHFLARFQPIASNERVNAAPSVSAAAKQWSTNDQCGTQVSSISRSSRAILQMLAVDASLTASS